MTAIGKCIRVLRARTTASRSDRKGWLAPIVLFVTLLANVVTAAPLFSQAINGSISGTVTETTGSVLTGAAAVITNEKTGIHTRLTTNSVGIYHAFNLQPGVYDLQVSASGFSLGIKNGIVVNVGSELTVDFVLTVASADQSVSVVGTEAGVDLESTTLSYEVTATTVRELPLNGRDFTSLATLQPSVSNTQRRGRLIRLNALWTREGAYN